MSWRLKLILLPLVILKYMGEQVCLGHFPGFDFGMLKTKSLLERRLYYAIRHKYKGKIKTQYPCGPYSIDFALPKYKLALECDGNGYYYRKRVKCRRRDEYLRKHGWKVMRFNGNRLKHRLDDAVNEITEYTTKIDLYKWPFSR
jgi:very-short-patch-repair endonuclease